MKRSLLALLVLAVSTGPALAQALPRISALYPPGARQGTTLDVAIRGGGLDGAREVVIDAPGITAKLNEAAVKVDPADQKVFTTKCAMCHELRGPATISRTADQWVATVDRMIREKSAPIEAADRARIVSYVQAAARASAGLTARVTVAPDAAPGTRQIRVVAANGTSTVFPFEVTAQPEALEAEPNNAVDKAPTVTLPLTVNGQLASGDADCFAFTAKKGERLVFNCFAYRLFEPSQAYFFPVLYLYDEKGKELARNSGYFSLDPLIDWTAPADGKYTVLVRDMLYRGSPGTIYRLSMGSQPYKTYLFPPGGKRGASTAVTVTGENMEPAAIQVPLAADAPLGVRQLATGHGAFRFVAGDYPELVEQGAGPHAVTLPISINGRIEAADETDRYTFTVTKETLGTYTFDAYAERVGSPLVGRLTLRNARGNSLATSAAPGNGARDPRVDYTFTQPGEYTLELVDAAGKFSAAHVYRISAGPAAPDFTVTAGPDNPNLGPGASVYVTLQVPRRVGVTAPIEVTFPNLPPGVTASPVVIPPNETQSYAVLTAAPDAKPGAFALTRPVATTTVDGKTITRDVLPFEVYRINNNAQASYRTNMVVTVGPEAAWTASIEVDKPMMSPDSGPVQVTVRLNRKGSDTDLPFAIVGVPQGVQAPRALLFKKGTNEFTFTMTPTNTGVFAPRSGNQPAPPARFLLAVVNGREGEGMMMACPPVPIELRPGS